MDTTGYITVEEAARRLGRSGQTVRRMRDKGVLSGVMVVTPKGKALLIDPNSLPVVDDRQQSAKDVTIPSASPLPPEAAPVVQLIRDLTSEVARLSVENGRLQAVVESYERKRRRWPWSR